jgi:hypothetical protein
MGAPDYCTSIYSQISTFMNVLILTPDAVGSTLLQRLITIYMQFHHYDRPVINLHELTNGLVKYHNAAFDQEVLGKKEGSWGYHQSLEEVVYLLSTADHYKTSRLAHYHIRNRQDSLEQQIPFYQYLNDNFYIISCRRHNVFEHALSWCLSKITKKLNVYSGDEKIDTFFDLYKTGIDIDPNSLIQTLNAYRDYVKWCNDHFNVASYFYYDEHLPRIEKYILSLPIFSQQTKLLSWQDNFDIDFDTWNRCRYIESDLGTLALDHSEIFAQLADQTKTIKISSEDRLFLAGYQQVADSSWPSISTIDEYKNLPLHIRNEVEGKHGLILSTGTDLVNQTKLPQSLSELLPTDHQNFLDQHQDKYQTALTDISNMVETGVLVSPPPVKKQTLAEKKHIIKNYNHLLEVYNQWIVLNPDIGLPLEESTLDQFAQAERTSWNPSSSGIVLAAGQTPD